VPPHRSVCLPPLQETTTGRAWPVFEARTGREVLVGVLLVPDCATVNGNWHPNYQELTHSKMAPATLHIRKNEEVTTGILAQLRAISVSKKT
jgi:hypothetical protein